MSSCHGRGEQASHPWQVSVTAVTRASHGCEKTTIRVLLHQQTSLLVCLNKLHCAVGIVFERLHHYAALVGMSVGQSAVV